MRQTRKRSVILPAIPALSIVLTALLVLLGYLCGKQAASEKSDAALERKTVGTGVTMTEDDLAQGDLILVNNDTPYDAAQAQDLVTVYENMNDAYFVKDIELSVSCRIMQPLNNWLQDFCNETGVGNVNVVAGHRTEEYQRQLYNNALKNQGSQYAAQYFTNPGYSEHHTGLAVDFSVWLPEQNAAADFTGEGDYAWLLEHAWEYGFIQRYPPKKQDITGIAYESWHFRYVGVPHAWYMYENDLCLEEYLEQLRQYPAQGEHLTFSCQGNDYEVYFCSGFSVAPPQSGSYTISGNNCDGFIVTVCREAS